jgi:hypothetical protein
MDDCDRYPFGWQFRNPIGLQYVHGFLALQVCAFIALSFIRKKHGHACLGFNYPALARRRLEHDNVTPNQDTDGADTQDTKGLAACRKIEQQKVQVVTS